MNSDYEGTEGQLKLLDEASLAIDESLNLKTTRDGLESEGKKLAKKLASDQKKMESEIASAVKKKRSAVEAEYDDQISDIEGKLKKVKSNRDKAKSSGMKERTKHETAGFHGENKELKYQYKDMIKTSGIPSVCGSKLFNILYSPVSLDEYLTLILLAVALLLGAPTLLLHFTGLLKWDTTKDIVIMCVIYAVFILLFVALYIVFYVLWKKPNAEVIREGRSMRKRIHHNKKTIRKISNDIKKDGDEEQYGLGEFDYEIAKFESKIEEINGKKEEALAAFDNATAQIITDEITESLQPGIDADRQAVDENQAAYEQASAAVEEQLRRSEEKYESVLGKDFMSKERIVVLKSIINEGNAATVEEAKTFFTNNKMG